jgi:hypothetical protein
VADLGKAWAVVRGRMTGNKEKAQGLLNSMSPAKRKVVGRQQAQNRRWRRKKPYKLGERVRRG